MYNLKTAISENSWHMCKILCRELKMSSVVIPVAQWHKQCKYETNAMLTNGSYILEKFLKKKINFQKLEICNNSS